MGGVSGRIATDSDGNLVRGQWSPLIGEDTFDVVQARTRRARPTAYRRTHIRSPKARRSQLRSRSAMSSGIDISARMSR